MLTPSLGMISYILLSVCWGLVGETEQRSVPPTYQQKNSYLRAYLSLNRNFDERRDTFPISSHRVGSPDRNKYSIGIGNVNFNRYFITYKRKVLSEENATYFQDVHQKRNFHPHYRERFEYSNMKYFLHYRQRNVSNNIHITSNSRLYRYLMLNKIHYRNWVVANNRQDNSLPSNEAINNSYFKPQSHFRSDKNPFETKQRTELSSNHNQVSFNIKEDNLPNEIPANDEDKNIRRNRRSPDDNRHAIDGKERSNIENLILQSVRETAKKATSSRLLVNNISATLSEYIEEKQLRTFSKYDETSNSN